MKEVRTGAQHTVLSREETTRRFDVRSWNGLAHILQTAREAGYADEQYCDLRDTVLAYAQSGGDQNLKTKLDAHIDALTGASTPKITNSEPTTQEDKPKPQEKLIEERSEVALLPLRVPVRVGMSRPKPGFATKPSASPVIEEQRSPQMPQAELQEVVERKAPQSDASVPDDLPVDGYDLAVEPDDVPTELPATDAETPEEAPVASDIVAAPVPEEVPSLEVAKDRIAEIKRSVNESIGNPAVLMSTHNEVGRTYMRALLDALKASSGGQPEGSLAEKMQKLEAAYKALLADEVTAPPASVAPTQKETEVPEVAPEPAITEVPLVTKDTEDTLPTPSEEIIESPQEPPSLAPEKREEAENDDADLMLHERAAAPKEERKIPIAAMPKIASIPSLGELPEQQQPTEERKPVLPKFEPAKLPEPMPEPPIAPVTKEATAPLQPQPVAVAPAAPMSEPPKAPLPKTVFRNAPEVSKVTIPQDKVVMPSKEDSELMTPQISQALEQLLKEWDIFKSSGVFGMGPGGAEHPLYEQIGSLPMSHVMTGRFERATPNVKQSIRDYVDAWRHEQGISYQPNETFETYLRRVIQRILKRQRGGL